MNNSPSRPSIDGEFVDALGHRQFVSLRVVDQISPMLQGAEDAAAAQGPLIVRPGAHVGTGTLTFENGGSLDVNGQLPADVPLGYHHFESESSLAAAGTAARTLIVTPGKCHLPAGWRAWGWAAQLYAARSAKSWGIGDLGDLARVAQWSAAQGAGFLMVNPLQAVAPGPSPEPSPYSPTSRRYRNPLYLDIDAVASEFARQGDISEIDRTALDDLAIAGRALNSSRLIDRGRVSALKMDALDRLWRSRSARPRVHSELEADESLQQFATWCVLAEHCGPEWPLWPPDFRSPGDPAIATFAAAHADRIRFHIWLQHVLSTQFAAASTDVGIIQDLPIGFSPTGADAWAWQSLLAPTVSVGAPPDEFNTSGQDWGLPPFVPHKLRAADYRPFIETIRATMSANGGVRIDHVMGLSRLWWIPDSNHPRDGAYVRYPADDLLDIVALESVRNSAVVVGEDLGTVEPAMRVCLEDHDVLSYRLLWFEEDRPARWPVRAMAALTTHDLPTVAGLWDGSDLEEQRQLDLDPNVEGQLEMRERLRRASGLAHDAPSDVAVISAHQLLASAPSTLLCATLDDALVEPRRPNIPGVAGGRPNWSIALPRAIDELFDDQLATSIAHTLNAAISG